MENPRQITAIQAAAILINTSIGLGVLSLPKFAAEAANTGGPLVTLLGILVSYFGLWLITKLGTRFPNQSIIQYSDFLIVRFYPGNKSLIMYGVMIL
ncbi:spore germination protein [Paenibacillus sp. P26]|nr:spore germination protein [Paenibacillus sp. P26]UUZ95322.1 spore germination protein [Paenibacillus sp. P25]